jgi:serine/threonine protein kinase
LTKFKFIESIVKIVPPKIEYKNSWCKNILKGQKSWAIDKQNIKDDISNNKIFLSSIGNNLLSFLVQKKCGIIEDTITWANFKKNPFIDKNKKIEYDRDFDELNVIGYGAFSIVCSARKKYNGEIYALKRIPIKQDFIKNIQREVEYLSKLKSDKVVKYYSSWSEENEINREHYRKYQNIIGDHLIFTSNDPLLNIQMEFCPKTLRELIMEIKIDMSRSKMEILNILDYSICCTLFKELLQCVDFLHKEKLIHRDLKPTNIMISDNLKGSFIKLVDFGLCKLHEYENQSHTHGVGSYKYMAPETFRGDRYNTKSDIYSIGVIMAELFNIPNKL